MALRTKIAKKVLTKKEQRHLTESGIYTMAHMKIQYNFMKDCKQKSASSNHPDFSYCFDCWHIAKKLEEAGVNFDLIK